MPADNDPNNNFFFEQARSANFGRSLAEQEAEAARSRARIAEENARAAMRRADSGSSHDRRIISMLNRQVEAEKEAALKALMESQELRHVLTEWQHSHAVFQRLAKDRGIQLGIPDEERVRIRFETLIDVAEESPEFSNTDLLKKAKAWLESSKPAG